MVFLHALLGPVFRIEKRTCLPPSLQGVNIYVTLLVLGKVSLAILDFDAPITVTIVQGGLPVA